MLKPERIEILGVPVDCVDMAGAVDTVERMLAEPRAHRIVAVNPEKVMKAGADPSLMAFLRGSELLIPDGIGVVLAARLLRLGRMGRVAGADLMPAICERVSGTGHGVFLFGASEEVNRRAAEVLVERYPTLTVSGRQHGYLAREEWPALVDTINASGAAVLFIALGSPTQELWMDEYLNRLDVRVCQGVGGTFDVLAGHVTRAPAILRRLHLEWLYRLLSQPGRLLRQTALPRFAGRIFLALLQRSR